MYLAALLTWLSAALAVPPDQSLTWQVRVGSQIIGSRTANVRWEVDKKKTVRIIESYTDLQGAVGPVAFAWQQRLTVTAQGNRPASFHSVIKENGVPREVQGRWDEVGWTITNVTKREVVTRDVPNKYVDLSTADLLDPGAQNSLFRYDFVRLLSAETGDVWEGAVELIGDKVLTIDGKAVPVEGVAWMSPEGRTEFWYNSEGFLVQYRMRVLGFEVEGLLQDPPPPGADEFSVPLGGSKVEVSDL